MSGPAPTSAVPWRIADAAVVVRVHVTPRASRDGIGDIRELPDGPALKVRVRAIPEDGKANTAVEALFAGKLELATRAICVIGGHASRLKSVRIAGRCSTIIGQLEALVCKGRGDARSDH